MTFTQFQATRTWHDDLRTVVQSFGWEDAPTPPKGYTYCNSLYIERVGDDWPAEAKAKGQWYLIIETTERITDDLDSLESDLFRYAKSAGYFD